MGDYPFISQYDMVLAVSRDAINRQFKILYDTPLPNQPVLAKNKQYLIDHHLNIKDSVYYSKLTGTILPPTVDFSGLSDTANVNRTVRLNFKLTDDADNNFTWYKMVDGGDGPPTPVPQSLPVPGYTFAFEASIGRADIQQVLEGLVSPEIHDQLQFYVDSKDFLPSSLFCLFESSQIANTFSLRDQNGNPVTDDASVHWLSSITSYYVNLNKDPTKAGNTPYVLGYSIQAAPLRQLGPAEFAPQKFHMTTTTTGTNTLNYCMTTDDRDVDPKKDPTVGIINDSFYSTTHSSSHDGILAMSAHLIFTKFIKAQVADRFTPRIKVQGGGSSSSEKETTGVCKWYWEQTWNWPWEESSNIIRERGQWHGFNRVNMNWHSSNTDNSGLVAQDDSKRIMFLDIDIYTETRYQLETGTLGMSNWDQAADTLIPVTTKVRYNIVPGADGTWIATQDSNMTQLPALDDSGRLKIHRGDEGEGVKMDVNYHGFFKFTDVFGINGLAGLTNVLGDLTSSVANSSTLRLESNVLSGLRNKILMPAGSVFSFTGLDTDEKGHVYTHIDYDTHSGGSRVPNK